MILFAFSQDHIRVLEREEEEERRRERKMIYRNQRKNREAFLSLLDQLHRQGKLTSISQWSALYPEISGDFRFSAMLTQPLSGSTPLDLFKFYVHDLRNRYEDDKEIIRDIIRRKNFEVAAETTYEEFVEVLSRDDRSEKIDAGNVKTIFEKLVARVHELEKMKLREEQRKKRKIENRFMNLIHSLDPAVDEKSIWEEVRRAISDDPDFIVIPTEEERIELFKKYIITVQESCSHHHSKPRKKVKKDRNRSLTPEEDSRSKERRKRRSFSVEEEDSRLSHEDSRRRRERPLTPHSPYDRHEIDLRDGERRRDDRLDRKRDPVYRCSRSPSPLRTGHSSRSSRGRSCEDVSSAHRHRKEGEERSPDLPLLLPKAVREPSRPKSPAESGEERETDREEVQAMDTSANNDEEEESDIEELERQRKILLQQLAAAASSD
jgi:pre-mRNA-processing factor 40